MTQTSPASPAFDGIDNFRDFGGYAALDGRRVKTGRLYRSAHHGRATKADLQRLSALRLAAIVDLRRSEERRRDPSLRPAEFDAVIIDNDLGQDLEDAYHLFLKTSDLSVQSMRRFLVHYYRDAPFEARHVDLYARYFQALSEADGPVLIHCAAGKDRTGILAALTHHLLGVSYADTVTDYLLTNDPVRIEQRIPLFGDWIAELAGRRPSDEAIRTTMGVDELYLDTAFAAMVARCGGVDAYLEQVLGIDPPLRLAIKARLLQAP